ncbi:MAG: hypothetical protein KC478_09290, partial [Bacteriovoracaceae bacterium]|nr:hypothetical protein [Bacteriovoracaceae bacterium]
ETKVAARPLKGLSIENERGDLLRLYLKLALYLNEPELILKRTPYLSEEVFSNPLTRELLGLLFYRNADFVKAYELIEDLSTPNSENIKGNIYLAQGKLELAYAQFKVALNRKTNSQNALERIIPTAWRLNQWNDGVEFTRLLDNSSDKQLEKLALEAAFLTKNEQYTEALDRLKYIVSETKESAPLEVNQLYAYNSLIKEDKKNAFEYANRACKQQDAYACWMRSHMFIWEDFTLLSKREDKVFENVEDLLSKYTTEFTPNPIKETIFVEQRNIEELEDAQIELIPTP